MIQAYEDAAYNLRGILHALRIHGQTSQKWADDSVSHDVASHYTLQLWSGKYCTYSALNNYHQEVLAAAEALRRTLADYSNFEGSAAGSMEQM
jgi:hypothetical protein